MLYFDMLICFNERTTVLFAVDDNGRLQLGVLFSRYKIRCETRTAAETRPICTVYIIPSKIVLFMRRFAFFFFCLNKYLGVFLIVFDKMPKNILPMTKFCE